MNRKARWIVVHEGLDVACSRRGKHLRSGNRHVFPDRVLVLAKGAMNLQHRNSPRVHFLFVELGVVVVIRQALAVALKGEPPRSRTAHRLLKLRAECRLRSAALPPFAISAALKAISPQDFGLLGLHVSKARKVNPVAPSVVHARGWLPWRLLPSHDPSDCGQVPRSSSPIHRKTPK